MISIDFSALEIKCGAYVYNIFMNMCDPGEFAVLDENFNFILD